MKSDDINASVIRAFDAAAATYDAASQVQREIARELIFRAGRGLSRAPKKILDLGCGAGHVTQAALERWPEAKVTALDAAPAMLAALRRKFPAVETLCADATKLGGAGDYDLIVSSMMAHWLPDPRQSLANWRHWLAPGGKIHVALPVAGSLFEWRDACRAENIADGLWDFPQPSFAADFSEHTETRDFVATYADAKSFLQSFKWTGARNARHGHHPVPTTALRRLLAARRGPFSATFRIEFLTVGPEASRFP